MSSYVAVVGRPTGETVCIFGLTPQEVRYLQVRITAAVPYLRLSKTLQGHETNDARHLTFAFGT